MVTIKTNEKINMTTIFNSTSGMLVSCIIIMIVVFIAKCNSKQSVNTKPQMESVKEEIYVPIDTRIACKVFKSHDKLPITILSSYDTGRYYLITGRYKNDDIIEFENIYNTWCKVRVDGVLDSNIRYCYESYELIDKVESVYNDITRSNHEAK